MGAERILFGTDFPWGQEGDYLERALAGVEEAALSQAQKELIYSGNARTPLGI